MIMPVGQLIMAQVAGPQRMGRVMGVVAMPAMLAPILGPVVGGAILQNLHWSWIFLVNLPIGVVAFVAGWRMLPAHRLRRGRPAGRARPGAALERLELARLRPRQLGTHSSLTATIVVWPIVVGLALSVIFCWHALRTERPLLDVRLYANRVFGAASLTTFGLGAALFGAMILVPLYYQEVRHESLIATGLLTGPQGLGMLLVMPLAGRLADASAAGAWRSRACRSCASARSRSRSSGRTPRSCTSRVVLVLRGVGIGFSFMPAMTAAFASLRPEQLSDATPQLNVLQRIGGAIGTAVLAVVLQRAGGHAHSLAKLAGAFDTAYWWSLGIAVLSLIPCVVLLRAENPRARREKAAANAEAAVEPLGA